MLPSNAVDYDEEYSALFGGVLDDQRIYLELCITTVLNLYKGVPNAPTTVTIVAHSMVCFNQSELRPLRTLPVESHLNCFPFCTAGRYRGPIGADEP